MPRKKVDLQRRWPRTGMYLQYFVVQSTSYPRERGCSGSATNRPSSCRRPVQLAGWLAAASVVSIRGGLWRSVVSASERKSAQRAKKCCCDWGWREGGRGGGRGKEAKRPSDERAAEILERKGRTKEIADGCFMIAIRKEQEQGWLLGGMHVCAGGEGQMAEERETEKYKGATEGTKQGRSRWTWVHTAGSQEGAVRSESRRQERERTTGREVLLRRGIKTPVVCVCTAYFAEKRRKKKRKIK